MLEIRVSLRCRRAGPWVSLALFVLLLLLTLGSAGCGTPDDTTNDTINDSAESVPPSRSALQPALHWVQDFDSAEIDLEVARLELGLAETRRHLLRGWGHDERDDVRSFVWGVDEASTFEIFLADTFDSTLDLHGRAFTFEGAAPQTVEVEVNGTSLGQLAIDEDFTHHRIAVPAVHLRRGVNHFALRYGRHDRPLDVIAGAEDDRSLAALWYSIVLDGSVDAAAPQVDGEHLQLPLGTRVSSFQDVNPGDEWVLGSVDGSAVELHLELETADGVTTWQPPSNSEGPYRWTLPVTSPQLARLSMVAGRGEAGFWQRLKAWGGDGPRASVLLPMLMSSSAADAADVAESGVAEEAPSDAQQGIPQQDDARPDIVIYLIDTLRADHLGTYGYPLPTSPRIDAFAEGATVFTNAQAQSSWTRTGVTSLFTGMLPQTHGVNRRDEALAPQITTLAEALGDIGYDTVGFITNGNVDAAFGLDQGFDHYQYLRESEENVFFHQTAARLNEWVFKWLDTLPPRGERPPFFLYVHATDPHAPYTPDDPYYEQFAAGVDRQRGWLENVHDISAGRREAPPGTAEAWSALYDGEIAYTDVHFGRLLDRLAAQGLAESSLMVLVSDHGEEFFEHGGWEHGKTLYGEQLRVPLIVKLPGGAAAGRRLPLLADQIDVMPTLLDYVNAEMPPLVNGQSLLPWMLQPDVGDAAKNPSYAYLRLGERRAQSMIDRGFKLIVDGARGPRRNELFHVEVDPLEQLEVAGEFPLQEGYLGQSLRRLERALRGRSGGAPSRVEIDEELRRRLEALGYVDN